MKPIMQLGTAAAALAVTLCFAPVAHADPPPPHAPSFAPIPNTLGDSAGDTVISVECNGENPAESCLVLTVIEQQGTAANAEVPPTIFQNQPTPISGSDSDQPTSFGPVFAQRSGFFNCLLGTIVSIGPYGTAKGCP